MQFIDPHSPTGVLSNGRVVVTAPGPTELATVQLDAMGSCPDIAFSQFKTPYMLVIHDADGKNKFQIQMDGQ
jgi:hypothetical protein